MTLTVNGDIAVVDRKPSTCRLWQTSTRSCRL